MTATIKFTIFNSITEDRKEIITTNLKVLCEQYSLVYSRVSTGLRQCTKNKCPFVVTNGHEITYMFEFV